jgi:NSS family neurotransmitter:Na+ symporter
MSTTQQEHWGSNKGFLLAALGSAVGLGNVWRFSYVAGENGGGAFLLVYLIMVLVVGVPLLLAEFALGRSAQCESTSAIRMLARGSIWRHLGLLGVVVASLILAYYAVIAGWVIKYLSLYLLRTTHELTTTGFSGAFAAYVARPLEPLIWHGLVLLLTMVVIARGIERGIEKINLLLMPVLAVLLILMAIHSATLDGFSRGFEFLFRPNWSVLTRPDVYLAALGQAFFSIGLAMGVMVTFGSYLAPAHRLPRAALVVALGDTLFAVTAGLVIFPAVFSFGLDPAQGPGLAFVVLPEVFAQMKGGALVGLLFFLLLSIAALTSMVSLLEVPVAYAIERFGLRRRTASFYVGSALFALGIPASLGFGLLSDVITPGGRNLLDAMDFVAVDFLLPLNGLLLTILLGWVWPRRQALEASDMHLSRLGRLWHFSLRYLLPTLVAVVLITTIVRLWLSPQ